MSTAGNNTLAEKRYKETNKKMISSLPEKINQTQHRHALILCGYKVS